MDRWEYAVRLFEAATDEVRDYVRAMYGSDVSKYSPRALEPRLNEMGEAGWELVSVLPVAAGRNSDIAVHDSGPTTWTHTYLCTFKRPKSG